MKSTYFLSDKMQPWIPRAKHNGSNFSHSLSLALSLLICFYVEQSAASWTKLQKTPRWRLELESLGWHVGWVKAVGSPLDGLRDQAGVLIDLNDTQSHPQLVRSHTLRGLNEGTEKWTTQNNAPWFCKWVGKHGNIFKLNQKYTKLFTGFECFLVAS